MQVFIHCLVFWREVQEYKALFIGASFSPCTVETRAKVSTKTFLQCVQCAGVYYKYLSIPLEPVWTVHLPRQ